MTHAHQDKRQSGTGSSSSRPRVLIIEDDAISASALKTILNMRGWTAVVASTIAMAMPHLLERLDAVVLDLMLPDGDGEIILELLKSRFPPIPVAVTTGVSDDQRILGVTRMGATALLRKPVAIHDLLKALVPKRGDA